jgi:hypothetical protein
MLDPRWWWRDGLLQSTAAAREGAGNSNTTTINQPHTHANLTHPPQVETIAIAKLREDPKLAFRREIILTKDGGAVAIDWEHQDLEEHVRGVGSRWGWGVGVCDETGKLLLCTV